jgi:hypothetical protein
MQATVAPHATAEWPSTTRASRRRGGKGEAAAAVNAARVAVGVVMSLLLHVEAKLASLEETYGAAARTDCRFLKAIATARDARAALGE